MPGDKGLKGQPGDIGFTGKMVCIILAHVQTLKLFYIKGTKFDLRAC